MSCLEYYESLISIGTERAVGSRNTDLANVDIGGREDDVYLDVSDGLETTKVPRILQVSIRRHPQI